MARLARQDRTSTSYSPPATVLGVAIACATVATLGAVDVLERSYNRFRTGANTAETILAPANVRSSANQFHKRFVMKSRRQDRRLAALRGGCVDRRRNARRCLRGDNA